MSAPEVVIHRDEDLLAQAVAARLITRLVDRQAATGSASAVLTGGTIGVAVLAAVAETPARDAIDWPRLDIWWGDERFLPAGHNERNETHAREALLDRVDLDPARVHPMPPAEGRYADDPEAAAEAYATALKRASRPEDHADVPSFDVLMLGVGPDAHIASMFPGMPALYETERTCVAVRGAPKPPPTRITLTMPAIHAAQEVWVIAAGESKAGPIRMALEDSGVVQVPVAGARGRSRTLFLLDSAAASKLPHALQRVSRP
ncbi:MAG: 6-phosphogluconolactonase [Candidatus Nanopelagicales bacterium]